MWVCAARGRFAACFGALLLLALAGGASASAQGDAAAALTSRFVDYEVWLVTIEPGEVYWQRFGHNTILIRPSPTRRSVSYNFGYFDFAQKDFFLRFLRGRMLYQAIALDGDRDIAGYVEDGRRVWLQRLALSPPEIERLVAHLEHHVMPENREYRYDYFTSNCSSKLRDALDIALDGGFKSAFEHRSHGYTFRHFARAYARSLPWLYLGIDLGLGQPVDRPLSLWEEAFIPGELKRRVRELTTQDGKPLVAEERVLPAGASADEIWPEPPDWRPWFAASGLLIAGFLLLLFRFAERPPVRVVAATLAGFIALAIGCVGLVLCGFWFGTDHVSAWRNENLMLFSPLWLLTVPVWWARLRGHAATGAFARIGRLAALVALGLAIFALAAKAFRGFPQSNLEWCFLMLPIVAALWHAGRRT